MMLALNQRPTGPDPSLMLILEAFRQSSDSAKETIRVISETAREEKRTAMGPRDLIDMTERMNASNGAGTLLKSVSEAYSSVFGMAKAQIEMMKDSMAGGQVGPVQELVGTALQRAGDIAQRYIDMKRDVSVGEAKAVEAQARAVQAQAQQAQGPRPGLSGPQMPPPQPGAPLPPVAPPPPAPPANAVEAQLQEHEMQLFGPALEAVRRLRIGVRDQKVAPHEVVQFVYQAMAIVVQRGWQVPALELFESDQLQMFVEALLPNSPQPLLVEITQLLYQAKRNGGPPVTPPTAQAFATAAAPVKSPRPKRPKAAEPLTPAAPAADDEADDDDEDDEEGDDEDDEDDDEEDEGGGGGGEQESPRSN
jgi:hypothetical protein